MRTRDELPRPHHPERKCYGASLALVAFGCALQLLLVDRGVVPIDEGQIASFAERILRGEIIYRDFYTGILPGIYYFCAVLFRVFAHDLLTTRVAQLLVNTLIAVLIHRIALRVSGPLWAFLWAAAYLPLVSVSFPTLTILTYSPASMSLALGVLLLLLRFVRTPRRSTLVAVGVLLAGCGLMKQNYGAFAVIASAATLLAWASLGSRTLRELSQSLATIVASGVVVAMLVLAPLIASGAGPNLFRYAVGTLVESQLTAFHQPLPPLLDPAPSQVGNFLFFYLPSALLGYTLRGETLLGTPMVSETTRWMFIRAGYGGALLLLVAGWLCVILGYRRQQRTPWLASATTMIFAQLLFLGLFPSAIWSHLATVLPPVLIVGALVSGAIAERLARSAPLLAIFRFAAVGVLVVSWIAAFQIARDVRRWHSAPTGLERASLFVTEPDATSLREAVAFLRSCADDDAHVFAAPDLPLLYFLSERSNGTPYEMLIPGDIDEQLLIDRLDRSHTDCIVYNPTMYSHFPPLVESFPSFVQWMQTSFTVREPIGAGERAWQGLTRKANGTS